MSDKSKDKLQCDKLQKHYWDVVLRTGKPPASVYILCEDAGVPEADFYDYFASLEALEGEFWKSGVEDTIKALEADEDYAEYDFQQKLLAFYYTYFSQIQSYRSRFVGHFPLHGMRVMRSLKQMRAAFLAHMNVLLNQGMDEGLVMDRKRLNKLYDKALFEQFRSLIWFYVKDDSEKFQDTDAFIEKTVKLAMTGLGSGVIDSFIDVARFLLRKTPLGRTS